MVNNLYLDVLCPVQSEFCFPLPADIPSTHPTNYFYLILVHRTPINPEIIATFEAIFHVGVACVHFKWPLT